MNTNPPPPDGLPELLPCPFCGGEAELWSGVKHARWSARVSCKDPCCGTFKPGISAKKNECVAEAIADWNTRAQPCAAPGDGG